MIDEYFARSLVVLLAGMFCYGMAILFWDLWDAARDVSQKGFLKFGDEEEDQ